MARVCSTRRARRRCVYDGETHTFRRRRYTIPPPRRTIMAHTHTFFNLFHPKATSLNSRSIPWFRRMSDQYGYNQSRLNVGSRQKSYSTSWTTHIGHVFWQNYWADITRAFRMAPSVHTQRSRGRVDEGKGGLWRDKASGKTCKKCWRVFLHLSYTTVFPSSHLCCPHGSVSFCRITACGGSPPCTQWNSSSRLTEVIPTNTIPEWIEIYMYIIFIYIYI